jgi:hypothetical protein
MKNLILSVIIAAFFAACSQGVVEEDKSKTAAAPTAVDQTAKAPAVENPHGDAAPAPKERKFSIPQEVSDKYKSLILEVKNIPENSSVQTDVLIGQKAEVTGTPFEVLVEYYLPDFVIDSDGTITTRSADENNPVVKIKVFKFGEVFFDGWLYKNHPSEHGSFADNAYSITLVKSVTK